MTTMDPVRFDTELLTPSYLADPYQYYRVLREGEPVYWSDRLNAWVLTRYDDVLSALRNPLLISGQRVQSYADSLPPDAEASLDPLFYQIGKWIGNMDAPAHTRLRRLVTGAFTPRMVEGLRPGVTALVNELLDKAFESESTDFIAEFAYPLPAIVIAEMLGVPAEERDRFMVWSDALTAYTGTGKPELRVAQEASDSASQLTAFFRETVDARRKQPREDLISALIEMEEEGDRLTEHEMLSMCGFLIVAGHETTMSLLGTGMLALLRYREQFDQLIDDPQFAKSTVEEFLRFDSPVQHQTRVAAERLEVGGREIESGQRVMPFLGAANRDPAQFPDPDRLDLARSPNKHLAFGIGSHFCLGAPLARLEAMIAFRTIADRFPNTRLSVNVDALEWRHHTSIRSPVRLPVSLQKK